MSRQLARDNNPCDWGQNRGAHTTHQKHIEQSRPAVETRGPHADNTSPEHSPPGSEQHTARPAHSLGSNSPHLCSPPPSLLRVGSSKWPWFPGRPLFKLSQGQAQPLVSCYCSPKKASDLSKTVRRGSNSKTETQLSFKSQIYFFILLGLYNL